MKKRFNGFMLFCIVVGVCMMFAGHVMGAKKTLYIGSSSDWNGTYVQSEQIGYTTVSESSLSPFDSLEVSLIDMDVNVVASDFYGFEMCYDNERDIRWENDNGTLRIQDKTNSNRISMFNFNLDAMAGNNYLFVYCPGEVLENLSLSTVSGNIDCTEVSSEKIHINTTSGDTALAQGTADRLEIKSVSGEVRVNNYITDTAKAGTVSGDISFGRCESDDLTVNTTSGEIYLQGRFSGDNTLSSVSGDIIFETEHAASQFSIKHSSVSGELYIDDIEMSKNTSTSNSSAKNALTLSEVSGDAHITFGK